MVPSVRKKLACVACFGGSSRKQGGPVIRYLNKSCLEGRRDE